LSHLEKRLPESRVNVWIQRLDSVLAAAVSRADTRRGRVDVSDSLFFVDTVLIEN